jgi:hypothetical protein
MSNVTRLASKPKTTYRHQVGDITRALAEGLRHDLIAADIELALHDLLFIAGPEDALVTRELLSKLLRAQN